MPLTDDLAVRVKADRRIEARGLVTDAREIDVSYQASDAWGLSAGVRDDDREDNSPVVPVTQKQGGRTDVVVQTAYESMGRWRGYAFGQATLRKTGTREENRRGGVGGSYRVNDRLLADGEVWNGLRRLRKDNTGYDLKQMFLGAEGTLGIITAAVLQLFPVPKETCTAMIALLDTASATPFVALLRKARVAAVRPFEYIHRNCLDLVFRHM